MPTDPTNGLSCKPCDVMGVDLDSLSAVSGGRMLSNAWFTLHGFQSRQLVLPVHTTRLAVWNLELLSGSHYMSGDGGGETLQDFWLGGFLDEPVWPPNHFFVRCLIHQRGPHAPPTAPPAFLPWPHHKFPPQVRYSDSWTSAQAKPPPDFPSLHVLHSHWPLLCSSACQCIPDI